MESLTKSKLKEKSIIDETTIDALKKDSYNLFAIVGIIKKERDYGVISSKIIESLKVNRYI